MAELAAIKYKFTSRGAIQIEAKDEMKKRLGHSPDRSDAIVLAIANPNRESFAFSGGETLTSKLFDKE